jgi:hypothetical protein
MSRKPSFILWYKTLQQASIWSTTIWSKASFLQVEWRLRYRDSSFIALVVPHDYCFLEVITKLNLNQNLFGWLHPVLFHSLCVCIGYYRRCRHNNSLKTVQLRKNVNLQDQWISCWAFTEKDGDITLAGFPSTLKGYILNWAVRRFGKLLTTTWVCELVRNFKMQYANAERNINR